MLIAFKALDEALHQSELAPHRRAVEEMGRDLSTWSLRDFSAWLGRFDRRLDCALGPAGTWVITYSERGAIPLARWLAAQLYGRALVVGRPPGTSAEALRAVQRLGFDFSSCRVRVGFARGHLLDVYVLIPLDVVGAMEELQIAAEVYVETFLGDRVLDDWVDQVAVDRIARSRGLSVMSDVRAPSTNYPLAEVKSLVCRGVDALRQGLPTSLLLQQAEQEWTALTLECADEEAKSPHSERRFASTRHPEALKACLTGLGFCSKRFTLGDEIFVFLRWQGRGPERAHKRERVEELIGRAAARTREVALAGSGFGAAFDYLDLWLSPRPDVISALLALVADIVDEVELGFYDSQWSEERLIFRRGG